MAGTRGGEAAEAFIIGEFDRWKKVGVDAGDEAVAAVMALVGVARSSSSKAETVAALEAEVNTAVEELKVGS
jgi:hypothetical protein